VTGPRQREGADVAVPEPSRAGRLSDEAHRAARNAVTLGTSLVATWTVAILVRLYLPRRLGPSTFGLYSFAESLAMTSIAFISLGVEGYSLREVAARPRHASDYFGGLVVIRLLLGALVVVGVLGLLAATGPLEALRLAPIFAAGFVLSSIGATLAAFLQANATVGRLAVTNVVAKVLWGGLMAVALGIRAPLEVLAGVFMVSETVRVALLYRESRRRLDLAFCVDWMATRAVVIAAVPYYANSVALSLNRLDVTVLGFMAGSTEVGWYGAAANFSLLISLLLPLASSVLLPTLMRVYASSEEALWFVTRRVAEGLLVVSVPLALLVALGADIWVRLAFGVEYMPAASSLRVIAMQAVFTYAATFTSMVLIVIGRRWTVTMTSVIGVIAIPLLGVIFIPIGLRLLGPGGAGAGAALGALGAEAMIVGIQCTVIGTVAFGRRTASLVGRFALLGGSVVALHVLLAPLGGPARLALDAAAYVGVGTQVGLLPLGKVVGLVSELVSPRNAEGQGLS
jgi:O-antigen/teichoic acid export membrane protein